MQTKRTKRVANLIKEILGDLLVHLKDPRLGLLTITSVRVSSDLENAKVYYSTIETKGQKREESIKGLESAAGFLQRELGKELELKKTPKMEFIYDSGIEEGIRISQLIDEVVTRDSRSHESHEDNP